MLKNKITVKLILSFGFNIPNLSVPTSLSREKKIFKLFLKIFMYYYFILYHNNIYFIYKYILHNPYSPQKLSELNSTL